MPPAVRADTVLMAILGKLVLTVVTAPEVTMVCPVNLEHRDFPDQRGIAESRERGGDLEVQASGEGRENQEEMPCLGLMVY